MMGCWQRFWVLVVAGLLVVAGASRGDVIHLKNGRKKEGKIIEKKGGGVVLEVKVGRLKAKVRIKESDILRIERKASPHEAFDNNLAKIAADDADAYYKLGLWAEEHKLPDRAKVAFKKALEAGQGHAGAAAKLGYIKLGGKWGPAGTAIESVEAKYKDGKFEQVHEALRALKDAPKEALPSDIRANALMLYAKSCERLSKWDEAVDAWYAYNAATIDKTKTAVALAHIKIIETHPDGQFSCKKEDLPSTLVEFDPSIASTLRDGGMKPLSDESIMDIALKAQAITMREECEKSLDKVVDNSDASEKALRMATAKAKAATTLLPGCAKDLILTCVRKGIEIDEKQLAELRRDLESKITVDSRKLFSGKLSVAKECERISNRLLRRYKTRKEDLQGFEKELHDEFASVEKAIAGEIKRGEWLDEQIFILNIKKRTESLEAKASANINKGQATDPRKQTYEVNRLSGEFTDGGKKWRNNCDTCGRYYAKAIAALRNILKDYQKKPEVFSAEIEDTKSRMIACHSHQKEVAALRDQKGLATD